MSFMKTKNWDKGKVMTQEILTGEDYLLFGIKMIMLLVSQKKKL